MARGLNSIHDRMSKITDMSAPAPAALWTLAFRPFFLAASVWAAIGILLWVATLLTARTVPSRFDPLTWHIHEMLFGFVPAAIAGFLFTAIATWTARPPLKGPILALLLCLWMLGRLTTLFSARLPWGISASVDPAFELAVCVLAAREIVLARNWRNIAMPLPVAVLGFANLLMYLSLAGLSVPPALGWRLGLSAVIVLVAAVGRRIIPLFTQNWLALRGTPQPLTRVRLLDRLAMAALHAGLLGWALFPGSKIVGALLLAAAILMAQYFARWRGAATLAEPLLAILHVGYGWLILGAGMLGGSVLFPAELPLPAAIHVLTIGAIGTMVLAVMTRVSLGHTGRPLHAGRATVAIYLLISAAVVCRLAAAFATSAYLPYFSLIVASAVCWIASFIVFAAGYGPLLWAPRLQPAASAGLPGVRIRN